MKIQILTLNFVYNLVISAQPVQYGVIWDWKGDVYGVVCIYVSVHMCVFG